MIVLHRIPLQESARNVNAMTHLFMTHFQSCMIHIVLKCQCVKIRLLYIININFKHIGNVRIFKCSERNQRSKILIFFRLAVSEDYFWYIPSHKKISNFPQSVQRVISLTPYIADI